MAGSLYNYLYETDIESGTPGEKKWIILKRDESNSEQTGGLPDNPASRAGKSFAVAGVDYLRIIPRYAIVEGKLTNGTIVRRKVTVFRTNSDIWKGTGSVINQVATAADSSATIEFKPVFLSGEKRSLSNPGVDTGLNDGTPEEVTIVPI